MTPVIAHPERYAGLLEDLEVVAEWRSAGAYLQVNGPSLIGRYGDSARDAAFALLENGWADYLSSDYHARGRSEIAAYRQILHELGGDEQVVLLTETNPGRLLADEAPLPVPVMSAKRSLWERLTAPFR